MNFVRFGLDSNTLQAIFVD